MTLRVFEYGGIHMEVTINADKVKLEYRVGDAEKSRAIYFPGHVFSEIAGEFHDAEYRERRFSEFSHLANQMANITTQFPGLISHIRVGPTATGEHYCAAGELADGTTFTVDRQEGISWLFRHLGDLALKKQRGKL